MKMKFYSYAFGVIALGMLASCSNDVKNGEEPKPEGSDLPAMQLAKAPSLAISVDNQVLAGELPNIAGTKATNKYENKEVEVNLAIQDIHEKYDIEDLVSHLSIHVRTATDVEIYLPVEEQYYCDQDDLYIYNERGVEDWGATYTENKITATIEGLPVTLTVDFKAAGDDKEGIIIKTTGIKEAYNAALTTLDNLAKDNDEEAAEETEEEVEAKKAAKAAAEAVITNGINFDIFNYYIRANQYTTGSYASWTLPELKEALDLSEIEFDPINNGEETVVDFYINAFTSDENGDANFVTGTEVERDCIVTPKTQIGEFIDPQTDRYSRNIIYINKKYHGLGGWDGKFDTDKEGDQGEGEGGEGGE